MVSHHHSYHHRSLGFSDALFVPSQTLPFAVHGDGLWELSAGRTQCLGQAAGLVSVSGNLGGKSGLFQTRRKLSEWRGCLAIWMKNMEKTLESDGKWGFKKYCFWESFGSLGPAWIRGPNWQKLADQREWIRGHSWAPNFDTIPYRRLKRKMWP